jgi:dihydropyrimidinase
VTDLVLAGGTVVTAAGAMVADVAVAGERIEAIGPGLAAQGARVGAEIVDAAGMVVLPGVVDVHTHLRVPTADEPDRFHRDTVAAALGGTTTVLTFNNPGTGISDDGARSLRAGLHEFRAATAGESAIDYGLCAVLSGGQPDPIGELPGLISAGVPTFKAFMVYDFRLPDDRLEESMRVAARHGGMLQVHCEEPSIIGPLIERALAEERTGPRHHAITRPTAAEAAATRKAIEMARRVEAPLYIVHLSCADALDEVASAKARGQPVYAETCPHYLRLTEALYDDPDEAQVIRRVISPPLRSERDVDALWQGLRDGVLDIVASDHVPDRLDREKRLPAPPFPQISNGAPGIETLLSVVYSEGVAKGRIGLERMVEVLARKPAQLFGLPRKGKLEVGADADLVILDPGASRTLRQADLHHTSDFTPYEGLPVRGAVVSTWSRGRRVTETSRAGHFIERQPRAT